MNKIQSKFLSFIDNLDAFQFNINLRLDKKEKTSTFFGKCMTICIFAFLSYLFFTSDFILTKNPRILSQVTEISQRPYIYLDESNFTFVIAIGDEFSNNYFPDPTYFTLDIYNDRYEAQKEGGYKTISSELKKYHKCDENDFPRMPYLYQNLSLINTICLDEKNITLEGFWDEKIVSTFYVELRMCSNSSESDIICKPLEVIKEFIYDKYFNIFIEKKNIDLNDHHKPISSIIKTFYKTIDYNLLKKVYYYIQKTTIETDNGFIFENNNFDITYSNSKMELDSSNSNNNPFLFTFIMYSDDQIKSISRKYDKIHNLLADLGGVAKSLIFLGLLIAKFQNSLNFKNLIINELYSFPKIGKNNKNEQNYKKNLPKLNIMTKKNNSSSKRISTKKSIIVENKKIQNLENFQKQKQKKHKCKLSLLKYISLYFKPNNQLDEKQILFKKGEELFNKEIDLIEILKKLKEIDKLKFILLDQSQLILFNMLSKPMINYNSNEMNNSAGLKLSSMMNKISTETVISNYKNLLVKKEKTETDKKIIDLLDEDISHFINLTNKK